MKKITVYTMDFCPYCESAKRLLKTKNFDYEEKRIPMDADAEWEKLEKLTGYKTMPQVFIGEKFIGGYSDLAALDQKGELEKLVKG